MKLDRNTKSKISQYLMYGGMLAVAFSVVGWLGPDIWLASTQWLLVALVLAAFAIYLRMN
jgi:hypothetical protein